MKDMKEDEQRENIDQVKKNAFEEGFLAGYSGGYPVTALRNALKQFNIAENPDKLSKVKVK